jgi:hypothetical protein
MNENIINLINEIVIKYGLTQEQTNKLIELGIDINTADMGWFKAYSLKGEIYKPFIKGYKLENNKTDIPAWSLHRLLKMLPEEIYIDGNLIELNVTPNFVAYQDEDYSIMAGGISGENIYGDIINCIEYLIKEEKIKY